MNLQLHNKFTDYQKQYGSPIPILPLEGVDPEYLTFIIGYERALGETLEFIRHTTDNLGNPVRVVRTSESNDTYFITEDYDLVFSHSKA